MKAIKYFRSLTETDLHIISTEASFVKEQCPAVNDFLLLVEGPIYAMVHNLYPKLRDLKPIFSLIQYAEKITRIVEKHTKSRLLSLPAKNNTNVEYRMCKIATLSVQKINNLIKTDPAKLFFEAAETLVHPVTALISTERSIKEAVKASTLLEYVLISEFLIVHAVFKDSVKSRRTTTQRKHCSKDTNWSTVVSL